MRGYGMWQRARQTPATLVEKFRHLPLEFEPGTRSVHSNSNYNVLALLIEEISGLSYGEFLEKEIFAPLGMSRSGHDGDSGKSEPHWAMGYAPVGLTDMAPVADIDWSVKSGNGSLYATTEDLYRLDQAIASESLELTRFRGYPISWERGVHDGENESAVPTGVPRADGGTRQNWPHTGVTVARVRANGADDPQLGQASRCG